LIEGLTGKGFAVKIPILDSGPGPLNGGAAVAIDQVHYVFIKDCSTEGLQLTRKNPLRHESFR